MDYFNFPYLTSSTDVLNHTYCERYVNIELQKADDDDSDVVRLIEVFSENDIYSKKSPILYGFQLFGRYLYKLAALHRFHINMDKHIKRLEFLQACKPKNTVLQQKN